MNAAAWLLLLVPLWPGLLALIFHRRIPGRLVTMTAAVPAVAVCLYPPAAAEVVYPWLLLGTRLGASDADAMFLLFTALVWLIAAGFAHSWIKGAGRERFFVFFLFAMAGNLGALIAQDMPAFYACFALMSFSAYGLIVHKTSEKTRHAGRVYIVLVLIGEAALALAMILAAGTLGTTEFAAVRDGLGTSSSRDLIIGLAVLGFGIKAGAPILHVWLPLAHPVAPAPASAVLSGTMIVTGLVGWLRFLPVGELALPGWGSAFVIVGLAAAFYGAFVGLDQRDPKVVLAYSSVSQMGIMTVGVGTILLEATLVTPVSLAIAFFALHHGLAKSALFLGAGLARSAISTDRRRTLLIGLALPSLALAGAPLTSGMLAKSALVASDAALPDRWATLLQVALPLASIATALLMARFLLLVYQGASAAGPRVGKAPWVLWGLSLLLVVVLPWWVGPAGLAPMTAPDVLAGLWPLGAALGLAVVAVWVWRQAGRPSIPALPEGDVLLPLEWLFINTGRFFGRSSAGAAAFRKRLLNGAAGERRRAWALVQRSGHAEAWLTRWQVALVLALLLGVAIGLAAMG
ncbi:MAG: hypothetical protein JSV45_14330 [Chromatiales bacterium]|nr:MAG: hypothetical protein JSV45_14330 [Chromatiales bacterium]